VFEPYPEVIARIMEKIVAFDQAIEDFKVRGEW
jgi:hypothetical protein